MPSPISHSPPNTIAHVALTTNAIALSSDLSLRIMHYDPEGLLGSWALPPLRIITPRKLHAILTLAYSRGLTYTHTL
jgi:hypothetical protein